MKSKWFKSGKLEMSLTEINGDFYALTDLFDYFEESIEPFSTRDLQLTGIGWLTLNRDRWV